MPDDLLARSISATPYADGVLHLRQQDLGALSLVPKSPDAFADRVLNDVVAENQADRLPLGKMLGQRQRARAIPPAPSW